MWIGVRVCDDFPLFSQEYAAIFAGAGTNPGEKTLEDKFFEKEVIINFYKLSLLFHKTWY